MVSEDKLHLQCHRNNRYESISNILTETSSGKHNMIEGGAYAGGKHVGENARFDKPILEDRSNEDQKSHISNACEKIIPTTIGFDDHMANVHTKKSPGWGGIITNIRPTKSLRLILGLIYEINLAEIKLKD